MNGPGYEATRRPVQGRCVEAPGERGAATAVEPDCTDPETARQAAEAMRERLRSMPEADAEAALMDIINGKPDPTATGTGAPETDDEDDEPPPPSPIGGPALAGLAGDVVRAIGPHTEADPNAVLVQFLVGFGNLVGRVPYLLMDGHFHHANEFAVIVGRTSKARKGTSWRRVKGVLTQADRPWSSDRVKSGLSSGEGLIYNVRDPVFGIDKKSQENVLIDAGVDDKRLLALESEFGGTLRILSREGNTLSAVLRDAWDEGALGTLVKNNPHAAKVAHVSIIGHVTREELAAALSDVEASNGFANRFLWTYAERSKQLSRGGKSTEREEAELGARVAALADGIGGDARLDWSRPGGAAWDAAYPSLTADHPGKLGKVVSRSEAHCLRLAMIYCLLDGRRSIEAEHVAAALEVWRYCFESARMIFGRSTGDRRADKILAALRQAGPAGMTRSEIGRDVFGDHEAKAVSAALTALAKTGAVVKEPLPTGGRPAERFRLPPA